MVGTLVNEGKITRDPDIDSMKWRAFRRLNRRAAWDTMAVSFALYLKRSEH